VRSTPDTLDLTSEPEAWGPWLRSLWEHRQVTLLLSRADFQVRYKRAALGLVWVVAVPLLQAAVLAVVFLRVRRLTGQDFSYPVYVMGGVLAWGYFGPTLSTASTAVVDNAALTDKVWFPRAVLPMVPAIANLVGLGVSLVALIALMPLFHVSYSSRLLLLVPACVLLFALTVGLTLVLSALHVYFRDVRYLVQAALLLWLYVTPIIYTERDLGPNGRWLDFNPFTGVVALFHWATSGKVDPAGRSIAFAVAFTTVTLVIGLWAHRRHDRLFVDLL
jgi:lipopolysaccharide transport system permease protein